MNANTRIKYLGPNTESNASLCHWAPLLMSFFLKYSCASNFPWTPFVDSIYSITLIIRTSAVPAELSGLWRVQIMHGQFIRGEMKWFGLYVGSCMEGKMDSKGILSIHLCTSRSAVFYLDLISLEKYNLSELDWVQVVKISEFATTIASFQNY